MTSGRPSRISEGRSAASRRGPTASRRRSAAGATSSRHSPPTRACSWPRGSAVADSTLDGRRWTSEPACETWFRREGESVLARERALGRLGGGLARVGGAAVGAAGSGFGRLGSTLARMGKTLGSLALRFAPLAMGALKALGVAVAGLSLPGHGNDSRRGCRRVPGLAALGARQEVLRRPLAGGVVCVLERLGETFVDRLVRRRQAHPGHPGAGPGGPRTARLGRP